MNQNKSEGQSCTLTAVLQDLPADQDLRTNTAGDGGTPKPQALPKIRNDFDSFVFISS